MTEDKHGSLLLLNEADIVASRQLVRKMAQVLQFSIVDQTKIITATSELSRNTVTYGGGGKMVWETVEDGTKKGLRLHFIDQGPGIPDLTLALKDGWTSSKGMGLGLSGSKRLVHEFDIRSVVGEGTCVSITRWK